MANHQDKDDATPSQHWQPEDYHAHARFVSRYGESLLDWLDARPGEYILNLGCGDGVLSAKIAVQGVNVLGVDDSATFVAAARAHGIEAI